MDSSSGSRAEFLHHKPMTSWDKVSGSNTGYLKSVSYDYSIEWDRSSLVAGRKESSNSQL